MEYQYVMDNVSDWTNAIHQGDAFEVLDALPENSVHAIVTDPPYGLAFMGRDWDDFDPQEYQNWCMKWAEKALRVLKPGGHLLAFSGNRTHHRLFTGVEDAGFTIRDTVTWHYGSGFPKNTDTQLKPATEFVVLARKPVDGSVEEAVKEHGTGILHIDGCRIPTDDDLQRTSYGFGGKDDLYGEGDMEGCVNDPSEDGRHPPNLLLGEDVAAGLAGQGANGSDASRFFYCTKASESERTLNGKIDNGHPTVKPVELMEWLVSLVTSEGQVVLDPFAGSGTTCKAAKSLNRRFIGIEKQTQWVDVARVRCGLTPENPDHVRASDSPQSGLEAYTDGGRMRR